MLYAYKVIKNMNWFNWLQFFRIHKKLKNYPNLSDKEKKEVLRGEAKEFWKKYGEVIKALANE